MSASKAKQECRRSRCATPAKTEYSCTRGSFCTVCTIWGGSVQSRRGGFAFGLHARRTRTGRRRRSAGTNSPVDCWLARGRVPGECRSKQSVAGVAILLLHGLTENVGLFFYCNNPGCRGSLCTIGDENSCGGDSRLRRKQGAGAGAAVTEAAARPKGSQPMRAPQPVQCPPFRVPAGKNAPVERF